MRFIEISEAGFVHLIPVSIIYQKGFRILVHLNGLTLTNLYTNCRDLSDILREYKDEWVIFELKEELNNG